MAKNDFTSEVMDGFLKIAMFGGVLGVSMIAPRMIEVLEKPTQKVWKKLDKRARDRELRRVAYQLKARGLIDCRNYNYGIKITEKGAERVKAKLKEVKYIPAPSSWDMKWRIVFYDIPNELRPSREALKRKLKRLNFYHLQQSVFMHPYPCKNEVLSITSRLNVQKYVSYVETEHIDGQEELMKIFHILLGHKL